LQAPELAALPAPPPRVSPSSFTHHWKAQDLAGGIGFRKSFENRSGVLKIGLGSLYTSGCEP